LIIYVTKIIKNDVVLRGY